MNFTRNITPNFYCAMSSYIDFVHIDFVYISFVHISLAHIHAAHIHVVHIDFGGFDVDFCLHLIVNPKAANRHQTPLRIVPSYWTLSRFSCDFGFAKPSKN
jgi:hypothetical protein